MFVHVTGITVGLDGLAKPNAPRTKMVTYAITMATARPTSANVIHISTDKLVISAQQITERSATDSVNVSLGHVSVTRVEEVSHVSSGARVVATRTVNAGWVNATASHLGKERRVMSPLHTLAHITALETEFVMKKPSCVHAMLDTLELIAL